MELFDFAYCPSWDRKLSLLASIALPEVWGDAAAGQPLAILKSYGASEQELIQRPTVEP